MSSKKTVLVVDDAATIRQVVRAAVTSAGYQVVEATNGQDALNKLKHHPIKLSLMITDINMPEMDGITLTKAIKSLEPYRFLPVVCLTSEDQKTFIPKAKEAGACAWIDKPFTQKDVIDIVQRLIK
jgi:two-component system chemotaxis response regulator CheY